MTGGRVAAGERREYRQSDLVHAADTPLFSGNVRESVVWMSHVIKLRIRDRLFSQLPSTANSKFAAVQHAPVTGLWHPILSAGGHSQKAYIIKEFLF